MAETRSSIGADKKSAERNAIVAAREELGVLERLASAVSMLIAEFSKRPNFQGKVDNTELALHEHRYRRLKAFQELAHHCYGRTVCGAEIGDDDRKRGDFKYRITQANVGYLEDGCYVVPRNSLLATELVTALPGDEREIASGNKERLLNVTEVRTFEGPTSLRSPTQKPTFRSTFIRKIGLKFPLQLGDIRALVYRFDKSAPGEAEGVVEEIPPRSSELDPTWLTEWTNIYLGEIDQVSLSHQFFTQTTVDQERALNNPRGLTFVEGIAGAGKTSVALGRLKFFANLGTGEGRDQYGLQSASNNDFSPVGMVGFVLNHSLKRYLKETAAALDLEHLPIRDFEEFRTDLSSRFGIADHFKRKKSEASPIRSRINWLRAMDAAIARSAVARIRQNLARSKNVPTTALEDVSRFTDDLIHAESHPNSKVFNLSGLVPRLVAIIADAELRHQEAAAHEKFRPRSKPGSEEYPREQASYEREMSRMQRQAEKKILSSLAVDLLVGINAHVACTRFG